MPSAVEAVLVLLALELWSEFPIRPASSAAIATANRRKVHKVPSFQGSRAAKFTKFLPSIPLSLSSLARESPRTREAP